MYACSFTSNNDLVYEFEDSNFLFHRLTFLMDLYSGIASNCNVFVIIELCNKILLWLVNNIHVPMHAVSF